MNKNRKLIIPLFLLVVYLIIGCTQKEEDIDLSKYGHFLFENDSSLANLFDTATKQINDEEFRKAAKSFKEVFPNVRLKEKQRFIDH